MSEETMNPGTRLDRKDQSTDLDTAEKRFPELTPEPVDRRPIIFGGLAILVVLLILGGSFYGLYTHPEFTQITRDISIIFLAICSLVIILLLLVLIIIVAYLVLKVIDLTRLVKREIKMFEEEIKPMLTRMQKTVSTVQGTTTFISDHAVEPVITTASTIAAARAAFRTLFRR